MSLLKNLEEAFSEYLESERIYGEGRKGFFSAVIPEIRVGATVWLLILIDYLIPSVFVWMFTGITATSVALIRRRGLKRFFTLTGIMGVVFPCVIAISLVLLGRNGSIIFTICLGDIRIPIYSGAVSEALSFFLRVYANIAIIANLIVTTQFPEIIAAFSGFGFPKIFLVLVTLTYRYFGLFLENLLGIIRADSCRRFGPYPFRKRFSHLGTILATLLLRSLDKGERVYRAMLARGYSGELPIYTDEIGVLPNILFVILIGIFSWISIVIAGLGISLTF